MRPTPVGRLAAGRSIGPCRELCEVKVEVARRSARPVGPAVLPRPGVRGFGRALSSGAGCRRSSEGAALSGCGFAQGRAKLSCARGGRPRELSFSSSEDDDGVLEGLEEFFAEERVAAQKKKKCKKLKDCKAAKIKRRKKEVMLRALGQGWWVPASCAVEVGCPGHPAPAGTPGDGQLPRV